MSFQKQMKYYLHNMDSLFNSDFPYNNQLEESFYFNILPKKTQDEIQQFYHQKHEVFLNEYFKVAKEYEKLEHEINILRLEIAESCYIIDANCDKNLIAKNIESLRDLRFIMLEILCKERDRYVEFELAIEEEIYKNMQNFLAT